MENYIEPILSEEQMAAYLDGMLSVEECNMVEQRIESSPELTEIQEIIDVVDIASVYESENEIPIECITDDFVLPEMDLADDIPSYDQTATDDYLDNAYDEQGEHQQEWQMDTVDQEDTSNNNDDALFYDM